MFCWALFSQNFQEPENILDLNQKISQNDERFNLSTFITCTTIF